MYTPKATVDFAVETIRDRHEHPSDARRRLVMHVSDHSLCTARVGQKIAGHIDPHDRVLEGVVWNAGLMHDLEHFDAVTPTGSTTPLLGTIRRPIGDGRAEQVSAQEAYDHLARKQYSPVYAQEVSEAIDFGTRYQFVDGKLSHVFIEQATNPLSAFVVAKADILGILTLHSEDMLDATLRFFLERYPELADHIIEGRDIVDETFEELREETLRDYASEECDFMSDQYNKLRSESDTYLTYEQKQRVMRLFDISTFISAHQWCEWNWLDDPKKLSTRLYRALPDTYKTPA